MLFLDKLKVLHFKRFWRLHIVKCVDGIAYLVEGAYSRRTSDTNISRYSMFMTASYEGISYKTFTQVVYTKSHHWEFSWIKTFWKYVIFTFHAIKSMTIAKNRSFKQSVCKWHLQERTVIDRKSSCFKMFTVTTMSWLTATEYLCHKLPMICYVCCDHNPPLFSFMTFHRVCKKSYTKGAICGTGIDYPSRSFEFTLDVLSGACCSVFIFLSRVL